jgi:hypothetical protein
MRNHSILAAGLLLSSCLPMQAQTPATQIVLAQTSPNLTMILFRAPQVRLSLTVLPIQLPGKPLSHRAFFLGAAYEPEASLESWLPIEVIRTPLLTESSFLIARLWRGLQVDGFDSTVYSQSSGFQDFRPSSHDQAGIASSVGLDGISLRYSFGRDAETRKPIPIWRCLSRIVGTVLN